MTLITKLVTANTGDCDTQNLELCNPENAITSAQPFARVTPKISTAAQTGKRICLWTDNSCPAFSEKVRIRRQAIDVGRLRSQRCHLGLDRLALRERFVRVFRLELYRCFPLLRSLSFGLQTIYWP